MARTFEDLRAYKMSGQERRRLEEALERAAKVARPRPTEKPAEQLAIPDDLYAPIGRPSTPRPRPPKRKR